VYGRPTYSPIFEEKETVIRDRIIARIPDTWRKDPGDFTYDTVAATPIEVAKLQAGQDAVLKNSFATYATGAWLDLKMAEIGLTREPAVAAKRSITVEADAGVVIPAGYKASTIVLDGGGNPVTYVVDAKVTYTTTGLQTVNLTCDRVGDIGNAPEASRFILLPPIPGIRVITDGAITLPGADLESDDAAYERYDYKVQHPDTGGNKHDYKRWVEPIAGVGKVQVIPRWNGRGTVKVVIVGTDYLPATAEVVAAVQEYLDPGSTGMGYGKAPCGAQVTVKAADPYNLTIATTGLVLNAGYTVPDVTAAFGLLLQQYVKDIIFETEATEQQKVVYAKIWGLLITTPGVSNFATFTINGAAADVIVGAEEVTVVGEVLLA